MNTVDLENILHRDPVISQRFMSVYPRGFIIYVLCRTGSGIHVFNTHPRGKSDEHWIAVDIVVMDGPAILTSMADILPPIP